MSDPLGWPMWLQMPLLILLITGAALEWFVTGYGGLLVIAFGVIVALCLRLSIQTDLQATVVLESSFCDFPLLQ